MKCGILLAAFGSGSVQGESTLKLFDAKVRARFPDTPVRWAFTSELLRGRLAVARKKTDSVPKALSKMCFERFTHIAVQPLQIIPGNEYAELEAQVLAITPDTRAAVGAPLLASGPDVTLAARAVIAHLPPDRQPDEAVILMGHGARHNAVSRYADLYQAVQKLDPHVHVGTMNGASQLEDILPRLGSPSASARVWLMPLLSVVGRHTLNDMAGKNPESWSSRIDAAGFTCIPVLKGTAEYAAFIAIWLEHLSHTMEQLAHGVDGMSFNNS